MRNKLFEFYKPKQLAEFLDFIKENPDEDFVYVTGINLHDNNLNIIAKANFAQPIVKRPSEKFLFRIKIDF